MSKKEVNLKEIKEYLGAAFPGLEIVPVDLKGLMPETPNQFFYGFRVGDKYHLAVVRATVEEETVYPILDGKSIAEQMRNHPHEYVVIEKGPAGKGTDVKISDTAWENPM